MKRTGFDARMAAAVFAAFGLLSVNARGQAFDVPVDASMSQLAVEVCISGTCDSDASPVAGTVRIELDAPDSPTAITLHDFNLQATQDLHILIDLGFITGKFEATASGLATSYAGGGPVGPNPIVSDTFVFSDFPAVADGDVNFTATNLICLGLVGAGLCSSCPCSGMFDLGDQGTQLATLSGSVTAVGGLVTLTSDIDQTVYLDPNNPDVGHIRVYGVVTGTVQLEAYLCGDANCDGSYDGADIDAFFLALGDPAAWQAQYPGCDRIATCDINADGAVDGADIDAFFEGLGSGECP